MKRAIHIFIGVVVGIVGGYIIGGAISQYQVQVLFYGPDQSNEFTTLFLFVAWPVFAMAGGFLGNWLYRRRIP